MLFYKGTENAMISSRLALQNRNNHIEWIDQEIRQAFTSPHLSMRGTSHFQIISGTVTSSRTAVLGGGGLFERKSEQDHDIPGDPDKHYPSFLTVLPAENHMV